MTKTLKKHPKKKFALELKESQMESILDHMDVFPWEDVQAMKNIDRSRPVFLNYSDGISAASFAYKFKGEYKWIPEPHPVLIFINAAYVNLKEIEKEKAIVMSRIVKYEVNEDILNRFYSYYGLTFQFVMMLFTGMEAFMNSCIPANFIYKKTDNRRTELYDKKQIEIGIPFSEKLKKVMAQVFADKKKEFSLAHPIIFQHIQNLKELRDSIVHMKSTNEGQTTYEIIFKKLLEYKYQEAFDSIVAFCNYYHEDPNFIEDCPCDNAN